MCLKWRTHQGWRAQSSGSRVRSPVKRMTLVGIIANPSSGRDIRRLVAHGSTFDNFEKVNIVRRLLLALDALGIEQVRYMPDLYGIVERAIAAISTRLDAAPLPMPVLSDAG